MDTIIIIGGNHHNGLNLARMFGRHGLKVVSVVIDHRKKCNLMKSRYIWKRYVFQNENDGIDFLLKNYRGKNSFVFPYSDGAAYAIDIRLDEFRDFAYVPSINGKCGAIAELMDKEKQYMLSNEHGIRMATSITCDVEAIPFRELCAYPYIIKPIVSAQGNKADITICQNQLELENAVIKLKAL